MISHSHKCIFLHISKCAGTTVEKALGIDVENQEPSNNNNLFGWNPKHHFYLQHATPQELFDFGFLNQEVWSNYFKFIIVRNPWDRLMSDYFWISKNQDIQDTFSNFIQRKGKFKKVMTVKDKSYRGDHLNLQKDYFYLNGEFIKYDRVLRFENLNKEFISLAMQLDISPKNFKIRLNERIPNSSTHYSTYYNSENRKLVDKLFKDDIEFLDYSFKKSLFSGLIKS